MISALVLAWSMSTPAVKPRADALARAERAVLVEQLQRCRSERKPK
jgi:hypothetical protein